MDLQELNCRAAERLDQSLCANWFLVFSLRQERSLIRHVEIGEAGIEPLLGDAQFCDRVPHELAFECDAIPLAPLGKLRDRPYRRGCGDRIEILPSIRISVFRCHLATSPTNTTVMENELSPRALTPALTRSGRADGGPCVCVPIGRPGVQLSAFRSRLVGQNQKVGGLRSLVVSSSTICSFQVHGGREAILPAGKYLRGESVFGGPAIDERWSPPA